MHYAHVLYYQQRPGVSEQACPFTLLSIHSQGMLAHVLTELRHVKRPVFLLLPEQGEVFTHAEHFQALLAQQTLPPFLCFIIPAGRTQVMQLARVYGFYHAPTLEEGLQVFAAIPFTKKDASPLQGADDWREVSDVGESRPSWIEVWPWSTYVWGVLLLLLLTMLLLFLLFFVPITPPPSAP